MNQSMANRRMRRELELLSRGSAAPGIAAWAREEGSRLDVLDAEIRGAADTPYEGGTFRLEVVIPSEYPIKPPRVRFLTRIYHPNIDSQGRICLDSLNMPPKGAWKPSLNIATLLTTIQALMSAPNSDDGLMVDITEEFRRNPGLFRKKAKEWTQKYACGNMLVDDAAIGNDDTDVPVKENALRKEPEGDNGANAQERCAPDPGEDEISPVLPKDRTRIQGPSRLRKRPRHK